MSHARTEAAYALADGKVYVIGGLGPEVVTVPLVEVYDVASDSWSNAPPMPVAVNHAMAAEHDGVVYVAGGYAAVVFGAVPTFFSFDGATWTALPPMPETRAAAGMVELDGKLYVIGGRIGSPDTNLNHVQRFDPSTGKWKELAPMRGPRSGHTCAVTSNDVIACLGGEATGAVFDSAEAYSIRRNRWVPLPPLPSGRTGFGSAAVGTRLYSFSGASDSGYLATMESLDLRSYR